MPIITFLQDIFSFAKGPYHRRIGRHTQRFCRRTVKHSANQVQKKMFLVTAICADEFIATLLGLENKRQIHPFQSRILKDKLGAQQIISVFPVYMSTILNLLSSQKERLLQKAHMEEQHFLYSWCFIFEYSPADIKMFNEWMVPVFQQEGIRSLSTLIGQNVLEQLFIVDDALRTSELETLQKIISEDAAAVARVLMNDIVEEAKIV